MGKIRLQAHPAILDGQADDRISIQMKGACRHAVSCESEQKVSSRLAAALPFLRGHVRRQHHHNLTQNDGLSRKSVL